MVKKIIQISTQFERLIVKVNLAQLLSGVMLLLIRLYQRLISPLLGNHCRFYPSCSHYACEALSTHSFFKAMHMILWRLLRCHPFSRGGVDEVISASSAISTHTHTR